jgi:hypothetical protein
VITQINSINPLLHCPLCILDTLYPLQPDREVGMFSQPLNVGPREFWVDETAYGSADTASLRVRGDFTTGYPGCLV